MTNSQLSSIDTIFIDVRSLHTHCFICTLCGLSSTLSHPTSLYFYFVFEAWCYWEYCHPRFFSYLPISLLASIDITSWFFFPRTQKTMLGLKSSRSLRLSSLISETLGHQASILKFVKTAPWHQQILSPHDCPILYWTFLINSNMNTLDLNIFED